MWPNQFGNWVRRGLQREHGDTIVMDELRVCGTTYYAQSPYAPLTGAAARVPPVKRAYGPWWLVTLCGAKGQPQVSLAVAAYSTDLRIEGQEIILSKAQGS